MLGLVLVPLVILVAATFIAGPLVRFVGDWRLGLDPFTPLAERPRLPLAELAARGVITDALRQGVMALLVLGLAAFACRGGGPGALRRRLGFAKPALPRASTRRLLWLLPLWPLIHIAWVTATAAALNVNFGHGVRLSPFLSSTMVALWLTFVVLLAPLAEELLLRGEVYARASAFLGPAATIVVTALIFCLAHVGLEPAPRYASSFSALARPLTLLPLALTLGWLRWRTGRLWPCMLLHAWSNLALVTYQLGWFAGLR
ncbi:CAAX protease self-immunity [Methylorubrum salsuginis]|uniref:CAAX protease self-immunity n=2 Tax=Methylorubrum salsuginis TaxID=414703 RepID=A0A1I4D9S7_9HYPH|nr:CPBP family intramembrane glutamic endopeptidase [Methylorubrum salsuginis]SFK88886.1 CAAX protease self-immunity [Methylorubrum salsuginis]